MLILGLSFLILIQSYSFKYFNKSLNNSKFNINKINISSYLKITDLSKLTILILISCLILNNQFIINLLFNDSNIIINGISLYNNLFKISSFNIIFKNLIYCITIFLL
jgi:hypothetical protein